ncbi:flagellar filament capping protein FliD [Litorivicinus lipolyticus]|uniref:Flagellar hook-associated protein 2 n=1 Tax=Litorivicinus lipolyticus TaxID=418701 RepID=A0A5Q2QDW7_9GAMM|nr:flagellar filament capping protein FliD [Litorivicinus lipolyticus]QGG80226.1 flagellar filament capping protein FliD [Litorivicinus lipolyticus]
MAIDFGNTDYKSLIANLVAAERSSRSSIVVSKAETYGSKVDALAAIKTTVSSLGAAAGKLDSSLDFKKFNVTTSTDGYANVISTGSAPPSSLDIEVVAVGKPYRGLSSFDLGGSASTSGTFSLTVGTGASEQTIAIAGATSLQDLASQVNASVDNPGVRLTVINDAAGSSKLYVESTEIGTVNAVTGMSGTGDFGDLGALDTTGFDAASSASIKVNGVTITNDASNTFDSAISGITIEALKATTGVADIPASVQVDVSRDKESVTAAVSAFVLAYNELRSEIREGLSYDVDTQSAGTLYGESRIKQLERELTALMSNTFGLTGGDFTSATQLGISFDKAGNLTLDTDKLDSALDTDFNEVVAMFAGASSGQGVTEGLADVFADMADRYSQFNGYLDSRRTALLDSLDQLQSKQDRIDLQLLGYEAVLVKQFAALEALQSQIEGTSSFLDSQFNGTD